MTNAQMTIISTEFTEKQQEISELRRENARLYAALRTLVRALPDAFLEYAAYSVGPTNLSAVRAARDEAAALL